MRNMVIEYENLYKVNKPYFEEFNRAYRRVLDSGRFILEKEVATFEKEFAVYHGAESCVGVGSGTDALIFSLTVLGLPEDSEVIIPSNSYAATVMSVIRARCKPVFVEPDVFTCNIDPQKIEEAITPMTRAVLVVHLYGKACDMDPILEICNRRGLFLVEDCAQAHGAKYKGRKVGVFGDVSAFSFYPTKNLGCLGDGGAVLTNIKELAREVRMLRCYGSEEKNYNRAVGYNSRLDELQAAFLRVKLKVLDSINLHKRMLASIYLNNLAPPIMLPVADVDYFDVYHIFNIRHPQRNSLRKHLSENGIGTEIHYPMPPHRQRAFSFLSDADFPISEGIHETTLSLPISSMHTEDDVFRVVEVVNEFVR